VNVKVDGRRTYFEWINAGRYICDRGRGAMTMSADGLVSDIYYGFDTERLYLRIDARGGSVADRLANVDAVRISFFEPAGFELLITHPASAQPIWQFYHRDVAVAESGVEVAADSILELAIPFTSLATGTDEAVSFYVELLGDEQVIERIPREGAIETTVPSQEYELIMWQV
jgi:hypothetical protein